MLNDENEAADLLQEVFVKIWDRFDSYDSAKGRLFTWMINLTRNLAIDRIRSSDYKNHELQSFVRENSERNVDREYSDEFFTDAIGLKGLILKLKEDHQVLIRKIYFEGYTQADLAEELDIPLGTLKTRLRTAIRLLKMNFEE
jgi:RNA polymerase sigma-70 factor (ECF subfamily)